MRLAIVSVSCVQVSEHVRAIEHTAQELPFICDRVLLSCEPPATHCDVDWVPIERIDSVEAYSRFIMFRLKDYVSTPFTLVVQADGYALDGRNWTDEFLDYDYIGAPWPMWHCRSLRYRVGNGGFSLRSSRWNEAVSKLPDPGSTAEDWFCCVKHRTKLKGMRIAPVPLALRFSCEHRLPTHPLWKDRQSFGFHGRNHTLERLALKFWGRMGLGRTY